MGGRGGGAVQAVRGPCDRGRAAARAGARRRAVVAMRNCLHSTVLWPVDDRVGRCRCRCRW